MMLEVVCLSFFFIAESEPIEEDINQRKQITSYLEMEFKKKYPTCRVCPYGSFYSGFALRQSDLDICVVLELKVWFWF